MGPAFCVDGSIPGRSKIKIPLSTNASPAAGRLLSGGVQGAGVGRLRGGFGFSVESARDIDDPTRATSDGFAGARGSAAEGAAEEGTGGAHEVEPWENQTITMGNACWETWTCERRDKPAQGSR